MNAGGPAAGPEPGAAGGPATQPAPVSAGLSENAASALCYVLGLVTGILFLILAPYNQNRNIRFHAFQSIFMHVAIIVIYFVLGFVLSAMLHFLGVMLMPLIALASFILWIFMIVKTYQGQKVVLPFVGPLAQQQAK